VEELSQDSARYVWVQEFTSHGELRYEHDNWKNEWDLVRQPDQTFVCETYMIVDGNGIVTPGWVNRLGACNEYFSPRPAYIPGAR
jgi:hypothetical protein